MAYVQNTILDLDDLLTSWADNADGTYDSTEIAIDAVNKTFEFNVAGNLSTAGSGVTGQCLYSLFKERWQNVESITKFDFPMLSITNEQFEFINGWKPLNDTTRKMMRTCGWAEVNINNQKDREYSGVVTLGSLANDDVVYFAQDSGVTATTVNTSYTGPINEAVQVFGKSDNTPADSSAGDFDYRGYMKLFSRTRGKIYADADLVDIGVTSMTYIVYRFPLSNSADLKITTTADTEIDTSGADIPADTSPYDTIDVEYLDNYIVGTLSSDSRTTAWQVSTVYVAGDVVKDGGRYYSTATGGTSTGTGVGDDGGVTDWTAYAGEFEIESGTYSAYTIILDLNNAGTTPGAEKEDAYEWAQYALRQTSTINVNTDRNGNVAETLVYFIGDTLHSADGVYIQDIAAADVNNIVQHDSTGATHVFPTVVAVKINFNGNLSADSDSVFYVYYTSVTSGDFGTVNAIQVRDSSDADAGSPISNNIPDGASDSSYIFNYAYSTDTTGGRSPESDTGITVVALGLTDGQYVKATGTITVDGATISLVAPLERNYSDPV